MISFVLHWLAFFAVFNLGVLVGGVIMGAAVANASPEVLIGLAHGRMIAIAAHEAGNRAGLERAFESEAPTAIPTDERL